MIKKICRRLYRSGGLRLRQTHRAASIFVTRRCERRGPRRATARAPRPHPLRAAARPPQDDGIKVCVALNLVIASGAKQSSTVARSGLLRRFAPRNDEDTTQVYRPRRAWSGIRGGPPSEIVTVVRQTKKGVVHLIVGNWLSRKLPRSGVAAVHSSANVRTASMNVVAFASRKGGAGKSTLAAHLAVHVHRLARPCLLIDDDPQGSLTLWTNCAPGARCR